MLYALERQPRCQCCSLSSGHLSHILGKLVAGCGGACNDDDLGAESKANVYFTIANSLTLSQAGTAASVQFLYALYTSFDNAHAKHDTAVGFATSALLFAPF